MKKKMKNMKKMMMRSQNQRKAVEKRIPLGGKIQMKLTKN